MNISDARERKEQGKLSLSVPVSTTAQYTGIGWGATGGMGYNFNQHHAIIGEFLWNQLYAKSYAMAPINAAAPSGGVNGQSDIYSVTGDYRYELRRNKFGTYFIGGGGWYYRYNHLSVRLQSQPEPVVPLGVVGRQMLIRIGDCR